MVSEHGNAINVFISYAHDDKELKKQLDRALGALKQEGIIQVWSDQALRPGCEWNEQIAQKLEAADLILLLISSAFLDSHYCYEKEMGRAIQRHVNRTATVVPIILKPCYWEPTPFAKLQGLPVGMKPLTSWPTDNEREEVLAHIAQAIHKTAVECATRKHARQVEGTRRQMLRILAVIPRPLCLGRNDLPSDWSRQWPVLCNAVRQNHAPINLTRLAPPTLRALVTQALSPATSAAGRFPHIIHFFCDGWDDGPVLEDEMGCARQLSSDDLYRRLEDAFEDRPPLHLCVFQTSTSAPSVVSFAQSLVPKVARTALVVEANVAKDATEFAAEVYAGLPRGRSLASLIGGVGRERVVASRFGKETMNFSTFPDSPPEISEELSPNKIRSLPQAPRTPFYDRERQLIELARSLSSLGDITIVSGWMGIGKTALALEAVHRNAWRFTGGVSWVEGPMTPEHAERTTAEELLRRLASGLDLALAPESDPGSVLKQYCCDYPVLLVLDHLDDLSQKKNLAELQPLIRFLENLQPPSHALITARHDWPWGELLNARRLLPLNDGLDPFAARRFVQEFAKHDDVRWLQSETEAAKLADAAYRLPEIIKKAVRAATYMPSERILAQLAALKGDAGEKLITMIGWEVEQLEADSQLVLKALPLFPAGSCTLEAMEAATGEDVTRGLSHLFRAGLLSFDGHRYSWPASVMDYTRLYTSFENADDAHVRLATYYRNFLKECEDDHQLIELDLPNIEGVLEYEKCDQLELTADIICLLDPFMHMTGRWQEDKRLIEQAATSCKKCGNDVQEAKILDRLASVNQSLGDFAAAEAYYKRSLETGRDPAGTQHGLGRLEQDRGNYAEARELYNWSLKFAREKNDEDRVARVMHELGRLSHAEGDFGAANKWFQESLAIRQKLLQAGHDLAKWDAAATLHEMASLEQTQGHNDKACQLYEQSRVLRQELGDRRGLADTLHALASLAQANTEYESADRLYRESWKAKKELNDPRGVAATEVKMAEIAILKSRDYETASRLYESAHLSQAKVDEPALVYTYRSMAEIFYESQGQYKKARELYEKSLEIGKGLGSRHAVAQTQWKLGHMLFFRNIGPDKGLQLLKEAAVTLRELGAAEADRANKALREAEASLIQTTPDSAATTGGAV